MKQSYEKLLLIPLPVEQDGAILTGSYTKKPIKVDEVVVEDYTNGFLESDGTGSFSGPEFKDISFE